MTAVIRPVTVAAVLVAAGSGQRLGAAVPKAFVEIAGRTLLEHAAARFVAHPGVGVVVVVTPPTDLERAATLTGCRVVAGGSTRTESVRAGLDALADDIDLVLVHDVARPFVPAHVIDAVLAALGVGADAAVPVVPIHDTVRHLAADGTFVGTVDRATLVAIQTPQGFRRAALLAAHISGADLTVTDDAALIEAAGGVVVPVPGAEECFKITTPADLARAQAVVLGSGLEN